MVRSAIVQLSNVFLVAWATRAFGDGYWIAVVPSVVGLVVINYLWWSKDETLARRTRVSKQTHS